MKIKADIINKYIDWKSKNTDPYGAEIFRYAEAWADIMEARMTSGEDLKNIAEKASHDADTDGITGFMYGAAVSVLAHAWVHGEQLRRWHNNDYGDQGESANLNGTVINPAIMSIG